MCLFVIQCSLFVNIILISERSAKASELNRNMSRTRFALINRDRNNALLRSRGRRRVKAKRSRFPGRTPPVLCLPQLLISAKTFREARGVRRRFLIKGPYLRTIRRLSDRNLHGTTPIRLITSARSPAEPNIPTPIDCLHFY